MKVHRIREYITHQVHHTHHGPVRTSQARVDYIVVEDSWDPKSPRSWGGYLGVVKEIRRVFLGSTDLPEEAERQFQATLTDEFLLRNQTYQDTGEYV